MRERLKAVMAEIEDINAIIQNGSIDPAILSCFDGHDSDDSDRLMEETDRLIGVAFSAIDDLCEMIKENEE